MFSTRSIRPLSRPLTRCYASTIAQSTSTGGAISIDPSIYASQTVKSPTSKKSLTHADYVSFYRSNPTMLILQHNNLTQSQLLKIRASLKSHGAKLRIIRVGIFEHAIKVAQLQDSNEGEQYRTVDVNSKTLSVAAKNVRRDGSALDVTQLLSGPICTITFPSEVVVESAGGAGIMGGQTSPVEPSALKAVLKTVEETQNKLMLLGGRFEGQVFAVDGLARVSSLPGLETLRGQLLSVLGSPAVRLSQLLGTPSQTLGRTLEGRKVALEGESAEQKDDA